MNHGRLEQAGTPEDIYERPRSEFVARFIGGTNILKGTKLRDGMVDCGGGLVLRCGDGEFGGREAAAVSVRPHHISLAPDRGGGTHDNEAVGTIVRQVYLGAQRDYVVALPGGQQIRIVTPSRNDVPAGSSVRIGLPPEHCRALAE
jgi:iron(III) transport system ATP-binding protein